MALTMLQYGLANNSGFSVITGEIGSGKTTLIQWLSILLNTDYLQIIINKYDI